MGGSGVKINRFSVVVSVYGVEAYIEQFFESIVNQSISFERHIELIVVDDGSLDGSAQIIKKWQSFYPDNIKYIYKENGGLSSARNCGMGYVTTDWVTFIDPDDFIDRRYFEYVDLFLLNKSSLEIGLISCNFILYLEKNDRLSDSHPLSYRFKEKEKVFTLPDMGAHIQLSVNSSFLRMDVIRTHNLKMSELVIPNFEDGHFTGRYLLEIKGMNVAFLREAKYYYRKRENGTSLLDTSWGNKAQYKDKLVYGSLNLLEYARQKTTNIPEYVQRIVLYDYIWYVRYIMNQADSFSFLSKTEKQNFISLSRHIFSFIDIDTIDRFNLGGCWFLHKVGLWGLFKDIKPSFQIIYIEAYDSNKKLLKLRYFDTGLLSPEHFFLDGEGVTPAYTKTRSYSFFEEVFVNERIIFIALENTEALLNAQIGDVKTRLSFAGKHYFDGVQTNNIANHFSLKKLSDDNFPVSIRLLRRIAKIQVVSSDYQKSWLLMDRDTQADDNAEHLYDYIMQNHPEINAFFILRRSSHDWNRLAKKGFNLLDFGSHNHKVALLNADHVISSHADQYVVNFLEKKWFSDMLTYHYTFLQHGVTQSDLSNWLNVKEIDLFITTTQQEFSSIVEDGSRYEFTKKEVSLTGFPRHDTLLDLDGVIDTEKLIVIMPTWRQNIAGDVVGLGNDRTINDDFYNSDYAILWKSFLRSSELQQQLVEFGFKVVFFLHANIQPYMDWFDLPSYIKVTSHKTIDSSVQNLFCRASLMITDYSSVAFEMAFLNKPVIYYQFDFNSVFGGGEHITSRGYYDYKRDGFGPVCETEEELIKALTNILANNIEVGALYKERMDDTFIFRDGKCCQRVFDAIKMLE